jgi:hypothetical protein
MRIAVAVLMAIHGFAHLPGFLSSWRLAKLEGLPYGTTVLNGRLDLGDAGIRAIGVSWALVAVGFWVASAGAIGNRPWWVPAAASLAIGSLFLCVLGLPEARIGVAVNLVLMVALGLMRGH